MDFGANVSPFVSPFHRFGETGGKQMVKHFARNSPILDKIRVYLEVSQNKKISDNRVIIIPNGLLSNDTIINFSQNTMRRLDITIDVEYGTSADHVKTILTDIINKETRILNIETGAPADPVIALSCLAASSVQFVIKVWVKSADYWTTNYDLLETIYKELPENNIEFPYQKLDVTVKSE